ncbi:PREDICTED: uncharacterized protein LOC109481772 [Branchiostoma belcheri]|uniref:Uncharacterized protein LOC109481772 n=1 Tax=Branchiostoma belcheri TaxID=7741 RepID=A0A6P5A9A3_BRABE|nr:PREDICTED: uncharacterized protein LOC109481772 [Branchiostoma belcheri]
MSKGPLHFKSISCLCFADGIAPTTLVSYCDDAKQWVVAELTRRLEEQEKTLVKIKDRDYDAGISQLRSFCEWLDVCTNVVLVLSRGYLQSGLCQRELELALASERRLITVLLEEGCTLPAALQGRLCLHLRQDGQFWPRLIAATGPQPCKAAGPGHHTVPRMRPPKLPSRCFIRDAAIAQVTKLISTSARELSRASSIRHIGDNVVGIWGMGGAGKTVLALMVARELQEDRKVFWVTMGEQQPRVLENLAALASDMSNTLRSFIAVSDAVSDLYQETQDKDHLIVLDDVWSLQDAQVITDAVSGMCQVLVITRNKDLLENLGVHNDDRYEVKPLAPSEAEKFVYNCEDIVKTYDRHTDAVLCIAVTSDNPKRVFTGSGDSTIRAWELESQRDLCTLRGHSSHVYALALSKDDWRLASASYDTTVKIWDADRFELLWTLKSHTDKVNAVTFIDDGERVVSGSSDKTIRVWHLASASTSELLTGHTGQVRALCAFHHSSNVASGSIDSTIRIWNTRNLSSSSLAGHKSTVYSIAITSDDKYLVSASGDRTVGVWNTHSRELIHKLHGHTNSVYSVALTPDNTTIVSGGGMDDVTIRIWSLREGKQKCVYRGHSDSIRSVSVVKSVRGALLLSGSLDTTCRLWRMEGTLQEVDQLPGHEIAAYAVAITEDGRRAVSGSRSGELRAWNAKTGELIAVRPGAHTRSIRAVAVTQDGDTFVSGSKDRQVKVWSLQLQPDRPGTFCLTQKCVLTCHEGTVQTVTISRDSKLAASGGWDGLVLVWNIETAEIVQKIRHVSYGVTSVALSGNDIIACSRDNITCKWSLVGPTPTGPTATVHGPGARWLSYPAVVLPRQKKIVSGCPEEGRYRVWDETGRESRGYCGHPDTAVITALAVDDREELLLSASTEGTITTVSLCGESQVVQYVSKDDIEARPDCATHVSALLFTRDRDKVSFLTGDTEGAVRFWHGSRSRDPVTDRSVILGATPGRITSFCGVGVGRVVAGSAGGFLSVWDISEARRAECWEAHSGDITSVVATTWEKHPVVLSSSLDHTVKLWSVNVTSTCGRSPLRTIHISETCPAPSHLSVTSDGSHIVTGAADNTLRAYEVNTGRLVREFTSDFYGVNCVGFADDDELVMCSYSCSHLGTWNFNTAERSALQHDFCSRGFGTWCHFSAITTGTTVVTGNSLNKLIIWDYRSGSVLSERESLCPYHVEVPRSPQDVTCVAVTPGGQLVVSGSADKSVRVWCVRQGEFFQLCRFTFAHQPLAVAVAKDGKICAGLRNGQVCFLQLKNPRNT